MTGPARTPAVQAIIAASVLIAGLAGGCTRAPIAVSPSGVIGPSRAVVEDVRPGRPPAVVGEWYREPIVLPEGLTVAALVSAAVGKSFPAATVKLDAFWITSGNFLGEGRPPIVGRLRARVANGTKSTVLNATVVWNAFQPTDTDFRRVLDGLLDDVEATLAMMKTVKEL